MAGAPSYTAKAKGGGNYNQLTQRIEEKHQRNLAKVKVLNLEERTDIGAKVTESCRGNLAWSRGPLSSPYRNDLHPLTFPCTDK